MRVNGLSDQSGSAFLDLNTSSAAERNEDIWLLLTFDAYKENNEKGFSIYHTTSPPQTTHTLNLSIWVSLFIFSKTTYPVAYLPQNKDLGQTIFSFPSMS